MANSGIIIPKVTDVNVTIDINHPQPKVGITNPALFVKGESQSYKEYTNINAVMADYPVGTPTYDAAYTIFEQADSPELVAVVSYVKDNSVSLAAAAPTPEDLQTTPTADGAQVTESVPNADGAAIDFTKLKGIARAAADYFYNNWEFAIMPEFDEEDALDLATVIEKGGYDGKGYHLFFAQVDDYTKENPFKDFNRTWAFYHDPSEYYVAALVGEAGSKTVGSISWKFVSDLIDVTPESLTVTQLQQLEDNGYIAYVTKGSGSNQTGDRNPSGNYIDTVHGADWIKSETESNLQNLLNTSGKLPFDNDGISKIETGLRTILNQAVSQDIIDKDDTGAGVFNLTVKQRADLKAQDVADRVYNGAFFDYQPSGAINHINVGITQNALA